MGLNCKREITGIISFVVICFAVSQSPAIEFAGGTGEPNDPYQIATAEQLRAIGNSMVYDKCFLLVEDIDVDPNISGNEVVTDSSFIDSFRGTLDGNSHSISNMVIESYYTGRGGNRENLGLIGDLTLDAVVKDIQLRNVTIHGIGHYVGALAGLNRGMILRCSVTGNITGEAFVGGLVGSNGGDIVACSSFCNVQSIPGETITDGLSIVGVTGGLVGYNSGYGCIHNCYATGTVTGEESIGGLVGVNYSSISNCYAMSIVTGSKLVGGLIGENSGDIPNCYATGTLTGEENVGGLVGYQGSFDSNATVSQCYAACEIIADTNSSIGGLIGKSSVNSINTNSFWDINVSGQKTSAGGIGLPTSKLQDSETYINTGWDILGETSNGVADIWTISESNTYPQLTRLTNQYSITQLSGIGTLKDPYEIATAEDLAAINDYDINAHYILIADIDMSGMVWATAPIFYFNGTLNGQSHTIYNLTIEGTANLGLFGRIMTNGVVTNLKIQDSNIIGYERVGILAGESFGHIMNCHVTGNVTGVSYVGGLVGLVYIPYYTSLEGYVTNCTADVILSGNNQVNNIANVSFYD